MNRTIFVSLFWASLSMRAVAQDGCAELSASQAVYECSQSRYAQANSYINKEYKSLIEKISSSYSSNLELGHELKSALRDSQNAWIKLRDKNCALEVFMIEVGTIAFDTTKANCLYRETLQREKYLKDFGAGV